MPVRYIIEHVHECVLTSVEVSYGQVLRRADAIEFAVHERVARITLNRPDKRNALTPP